MAVRRLFAKVLAVAILVVFLFFLSNLQCVYPVHKAGISVSRVFNYNGSNVSSTHKSFLTVQEALHWASTGWEREQHERLAARPMANSSDPTLTSTVYEQLTGEYVDLVLPLYTLSRYLTVCLHMPAARSLNPPPPLSQHTPLAALELQSRLVVAIVAAVHSGGMQPGSVQDMPIIKTAVSSLLPTLQPAYNYRYVSTQHQTQKWCCPFDVACVPTAFEPMAV